MAMTEVELIRFYGGPTLWDALDEAERMYLRELHRDGNHRVPPDAEEQARRQALWESIKDKQARLTRRRGNVQGSDVGRR